MTFVVGKCLTPLDVCSISFLFSGLVRRSAKFNYDLTRCRDITLVSSSYRTILCLRCICLFFPVNILLLALAIAAWLSQHIDMEGVGLAHSGISDNRFLSHSASELTFFRAINSASIVD